MTQPFQWWFSQDEERWQGPEPTREAAIEQGRTEYDGEAFSIVEANLLEIDYVAALDLDFFWGRLDDVNEEARDPDDDYGLADKVPDDAARDLEARIKATIAQWAADHTDVPRTGWGFDVMRNQETILAVDAEPV